LTYLSHDSWAPSLDGKNLLPFLGGERQDEPHDALFWKLATYSAVRVGKWKLYLEPKNNVARLGSVAVSQL
jgi:hypothetical protein